MSTITTGPMGKNSTQVHTTTDYHFFKPIEGNRNLNLMHLNRLKASMAEQYLFTVVIVNEKYEIIDGSHRFHCIKELALPLHYLICPGYGLHEVHVLNANSKTWTTDDYLVGYCNLGYPEYLAYRDFKNEYGFGHHETMAMLCGGSNTSYTKAFWNGKFKAKDLEEAKRIAQLIMMIEPFYDGFRRRTFVYAVMGLLKKEVFSFSEFIIKLKSQPTALVDCTSVESYVTLIEEIYNWKRKVKVNLRY